MIDDPKYDIFYTEDEDKDTSSNWDMVLTPTESLNNKGDIRFQISPSDTYWMDLSHGHINFEARIVHKDGTVPADTESIIFINNAAHSLFSDFKVKINESMVYGGDNNYHYVAFMHNHLQYTHGVKSTLKITEGYHVPCDDNKSKNFKDWGHTTNEALAAITSEGKWVKFTIPLRTIPIMNQDKALPPGKKISITLVRNDPKFVIFAKDASKEYDFEIQNMDIIIPMIRPRNSIQAQIAEKSRTTKASYYYPELRMLCHTIYKGTARKEINDVFQKSPVKLAFFVLFPSALYNNTSTRKFIFKPHELNELDLRTEGRSVSGQELTVSNASEAYRHFNRQFNLYAGNEDIGINLDEFEKYSNIWPFDCTLGGNIDVRQGGEHKRLYDLVLKFSQPTKVNLDVLCFFVEDKRFLLGPGNEVISADYAK